MQCIKTIKKKATATSKFRGVLFSLKKCKKSPQTSPALALLV